MATPPFPTITASIDVELLARSAAIAAVLVSPLFVVKWRQVRRIRRAEAEATAVETVEPEPEFGTTLEEVVASVEAAAERIAAGDPGVFVELHRAVTVDGRTADPAVVDAVVRDTVRRTGLVVTAEVDRGEVRLLELRGAAPRG